MKILNLKAYVIFPEQKISVSIRNLKSYDYNQISKSNILTIPERLAVDKHIFEVTSTSKYLLFAPNTPIM